MIHLPGEVLTLGLLVLLEKDWLFVGSGESGLLKVVSRVTVESPVYKVLHSSALESWIRVGVDRDKAWLSYPGGVCWRSSGLADSEGFLERLGVTSDWLVVDIFGVKDVDLCDLTGVVF